jgi:hypothetical protein
MVRPGPTESEVESLYTGGVFKVPNAYLIAIPYAQKAAAGDVVLTWWQHGSGMHRAIVVEASNPSEPTVRYLEKLSDPDKQEKLKPNSFVRLGQPFQPGSVVAVKNSGGGLEQAWVVSIAGDRVFITHPTGQLAVVNKSACTPVPNVPRVKAGERVKAVQFGSYKDATVVGVDDKLGKVVFKVDGMDGEKTVDFGQVLKS